MPAEEELTFADRVKLSIFFFQLFGHDHLQLVLHLPGHKGWAPTGPGTLVSPPKDDGSKHSTI